VAGLVGMALADPRDALGPMVWCALAVAFGSATQDIALDAFRIESADANHQAALAATYQTGYRLAMIWAGAGVLWIAARAEVAPAARWWALGQALAQGAAAYQNGAWQAAYLVMAASMAVGVVTVLFSREPAPVPSCRPPKMPPNGCKGAVVEPFADFLRRYGWQAALILALIAVYRISDVVMGIMANPFYVDMGYTKDEVAAVTKVYGVIMTLVGAFVGGVLSMRLGVMRILMLGAVLSAASNLLFAWLAGPWARRDGADCRGVGRQPGQRHCVGRLHCLPVQPDQRELLGHAVRAVQLDDAAAAQVCGRLFGRLCRLRLATRSSSRHACWGCRCWGWCGWLQGLKRPLALYHKAQAAI
jgi:MFS-type transporter involved in bile tolerance (Atg22 family)